nr:undecaprenyl phosphate-alpha-4-amino-4-deoxy-L-arabinose arabinosyl transferase [uncultured bacterium]
MSMDVSWAKSFLESSRTVWMISAVILCLFALTNLPWQLDDYDQAQHAFTSFEMIKEGHWFFQRTPHELIAQKPPLVGWASAAIFAVTRSWDIAWRLPSFLTAVVLATILFRAAMAAYGAAAALIALGAFGLNLLTVRLATLVRTDMPLALVIFLIGLLIWQKIRAREPWQPRDRWKMSVLLTASMFIKGPIVFAFVLPGIVLFQWLAGKSRTENAWCGLWPWIGSLALFSVWVICGIKFVPGFYEQVVMKEFLGRFTETVHRPQPVLYYLPHLLHKFAPWSVLILALGVLSFRRTHSGIRNLFRQTKPDILWLVCWSLGGFVVMSLVPSKRVDRIYPVVPPLCLLLAAQIVSGFRIKKTEERVLQWSALALLFSIVFTGSYAVAKMQSDYRDHVDHLEVFSRAVNEQAVAHHWRYEVISGEGGGYEGMLLYLQKPRFIEPDEAVREWNGRALDALVVPENKISGLMPKLQNAAIAPFRSVDRKTDPQIAYFLVTRS